MRISPQRFERGSRVLPDDELRAFLIMVCLAREEQYVLGCYRYIELNPVRAGMVAHPAEYRWSSYRMNAQGDFSSLIKPQGHYLGLGPDDCKRQGNYQELFRY